MKPGNSILSGYGTTIFEVMSRLASHHGAINLGQGFPEGLESERLLGSVSQLMTDGPQQYAPMMGVPELRRAIATHAKRFYDLDIDPETEVMVTSGGTEALADCLFGLIEPGDEVVLIETLYDSYLPILRRAGATARLVRLQPPEWNLPREELAAAFGPKTKLMILNSPMNPNGKVFTRDELEFIAGLLIKHDAYCVCDEVYEHQVYDGRQHIPLMTLPGMRDRCLKVGSAGKTFSVTGWKVGHVIAAPHLLQPVAKAHQYITFSTHPGLQIAVAEGLRWDDEYFIGLTRGLQSRRDRLSKGLSRIGFEVLPCAGSYFLTVDYRAMAKRKSFTGEDAEFCRLITMWAGVAAVPVSAFYQDGDEKNYVRFCFAKTEEILDVAIHRLSDYFS